MPLFRFRPLLLAALAFCFAGPVGAQMTAPNPYQAIDGWGELPDGRVWGATSAVYPTPDGRGIWVAERCGQNGCLDRDDVDPILLFDLDGNLIRSFGAGMFLWPHGIHVDAEGNVWVTDAVGYSYQADHRGHAVHKFSPEGELLMTLGTPGRRGGGALLNKPTDVLVAPDGSIFVADGHEPDGGHRIAKFAADGTFLFEWGSPGMEFGEFVEPHGLAMDSQGRLFVADRGASRIQIFDQDGVHLATWTQFGRPSGIFIDSNDMLYATDSESRLGRNQGWMRGVYIGSARTGFVSAFIPDPEQDPDNTGTSAAEGIAADYLGNLYGAEVGPRQMRKYVKIR